MRPQTTPARARGSGFGRSPTTRSGSVVEVAWSGGGLEGDGIAELLELADQPAGFALGIAAALEVVLAKIVERLAGGKHGPDHDHQAVGNRHRGLVRPAAAGDLAVLGGEVAPAGAGRRPGGFDQDTPQPAVAGRGRHVAALAGRLVV